LKIKTALLFTLLFLVTLALAGNSGCKKKSQSTKADVFKKTEGTTVKKEAWGNIDGKEVFLYTLTNSNGMVCKLTNWGATVTELHVPDRDGNVEDVVLGFESLDRWLDSDGKGTTNPAYMGATIGRVCNRIADGRFELDGKAHQLAKNNGPNHLHGGDEGWDKKVWEGKVLEQQDGVGVRFLLVSPDGDENYPGEVTAEVVYLLTDDDALKVEFGATTDQRTPVNMTNHSYFNLAGEGEGTILDHELKLESPQQTAFDETGIPTGKLARLEKTPLDFTAAQRIGARIGEIPGDPGGYDHNFVLREEKVSEPQLAATLYDPKSGRELQLYTTEVGIQFYSGNYLDGSLRGKSGKKYEKNFGLCLEPQFHPDSPNQAHFPDSILEPGQRYEHKCVYQFGVRK